MEHLDELIAAHALHALDAQDERRVDAHLAECERCRAQLREMQAVSAAIALSAPAAEPPAELRDRVMASIGPAVVSTVRDDEQPAGRRWAWWPRFSAVAVPVLAVAVVGLVIWNVSLRHDQGPHAITAVTTVGNVGNLVAYQGGDATLVGNLRPAPANHTYEAWVIPHGQSVPIAAGTFAGGNGISFTLTKHAAPGDTIVITLEPGHGGPTPRGPAVAKAVLPA
ncbi:MAG TPA: anti-sigma factor [Gaiellales bacterium]|nr:anti-sigma factor [Gaiellales bacterium]